MTANSPLKVRQGSEYGVRWPVSPDPTGGTVKAQVRTRVSDPAVLHEWSTAAGNATVTAEGVTLYVPAEVSSAWTFKKGVYDVELTMPNGETYRIAEGKIEVSPEVTVTDPITLPPVELPGVIVGQPLELGVVQGQPQVTIVGSFAGSDTDVQAAIDEHRNDPLPHPIYDDMPSLTLLFENGLVTDMSLATNVTNLATRVATEIKAVRTLVNGNQAGLSGLTTTAKSNLVAAINELQTEINAVSAGTGAISDSTTGTDTTWSSTKINSSITSALSALTAGAAAALDTLDELAAALGDDANFGATVTAALGNRVRFDAAQTLTGPQQAQARTNIGAAASVDVGDTTTDFVATFNAGLV